MELVKSYSAQYPKNGVGRIYLTQKKILEISGIATTGSYTAIHSEGKIEIKPSLTGVSNLFKTKRGLLLELKNKATATSVMYAKKVLVVASKGLIKIIPHPAFVSQQQRERRFLNKALTKKAFISGSLYSGLGLLNLRIKEGLSDAGYKTEIKFANDFCEAAMAVNSDTNPIWKSAAKDSLVVIDDIRNLHYNKIPEVDILDISYPCNGQSKLARKDQRDTLHSEVGTLFIPTVHAIKKANPSIIIFECTPMFNSSQTLELIQRELHGYKWSKTILNGLDFGEIEQRERACVIAISSGLIEQEASIEINLKKEANNTQTLNDFLEPASIKNEEWKEYAHVKAKAAQANLSFKLGNVTPSSKVIPTIIGTYSSPKIGSPFIEHPTNKKLMRLITPAEHSNIRRLPASMKQAIAEIVDGSSYLTNSRGSKTLAHKLLGLSVSKFVWNAVGRWLGDFISSTTMQKQLNFTQ